MKNEMIVTLAVAILGISSVSAQRIPNELIDDVRFREIVVSSVEEREAHRLTEEEFLEALASGDYVLLDARSAPHFRLRHIRGAINLPLPDFTAVALAQAIPDRDRKILIYCNNNFLGSAVSFATKAPAAALNLHTQAALRAYGYTRIYELGPVLDVRTTKIPMAGEEVERSPERR